MIYPVLVSGVFQTYAYFYIDDTTKRGFLIDPGAEASTLLTLISENGFTIEKILLTHGHFDHFGAAEELQNTLCVPICMHENGIRYVTDPVWNLSSSCGEPMTLDDVTFLPDGSRIIAGDLRLRLIHVPGHTTDSCLFLAEHEPVCFVGDTIFRQGIGMTHFYGGNREALLNSIQTRIFTLPGETVLLSGHSESTTVEAELNRYR